MMFNLLVAMALKLRQSRKGNPLSKESFTPHGSANRTVPHTQFHSSVNAKQEKGGDGIRKSYLREGQELGWGERAELERETQEP